MERDPVAFLSRRLPDLLTDARDRVAAFLGADPGGLAFVPNATAAVNTVLASRDVRPGDRLVTTDHAYGAVRNAMRSVCDRSGASMVEVHVPLEAAGPEVVALIDQELDERTRLVVIDHVTSPTALVLPVDGVVAACRDRGVACLVDAAHAPGMLPVDVGAMGADYWTGNLHKWVCAPKGSAVLWVAPEHRDRLHPLAVSHGYGQGFITEFDWTGTADPTPYLAAPAAIDLLGGLGWPRLWRHNHALALFGRDAVAGELGTGVPVTEDRFGSMSLVELPPATVTSQAEGLALQERLFDEYRIEVPVTTWDGRAFLRLSAHAYNAPEEYERLAAAVGAFGRRGGSPIGRSQGP
jgi:isopenicillin-N epimerase